MHKESWEELPLVEPIHFFAFAGEILYYKEKKWEHLGKKYLLPFLDDFYKDPPFAQIALGWNEEGLFCTLYAAHAPLIRYPSYREADSLELFFDTRDRKDSLHIHKFCHHFVFLPLPWDNEGEVIEGIEVTRFRGEDKHELADPKKLRVEYLGKKGYTLNIFIPAECLWGYDPITCDRLGFTYRINHSQRDPQDFTVNSKELGIEQNPSLWASMHLKR